MWRDAYGRMQLARSSLDTGQYAAAIRESQACIERVVKSLLDSQNVDYTIKRGKGKVAIPHDASRHIPEAFEKLKAKFDEGQLYERAKKLARAGVLVCLLTAIREYAEFGLKEMDLSPQDIFDKAFAQDLSTQLLDLVKRSYVDVSVLIRPYDVSLDRLRPSKRAKAPR